jgi:hypothetical protein
MTLGGIAVFPKATWIGLPPFPGTMFRSGGGSRV